MHSFMSVILWFLYLSSVDANVLVAEVEPLPEDDGKLLHHGDVPDEPFPGLLEALRGQEKKMPDSSSFPLQNQKLSSGARTGKYGGGDGSAGSSLTVIHVCTNGNSVDKSVALVEKPLLGHHFRHLLTRMLHEGALDLHDVVGTDPGAPWHYVV
jgi:hypothetical protein